MILKRDYELDRATKYIESLDNSDESKMIRYYITCKKNHIRKLSDKLKDYTDLFRMFNKLLPNKNILR